MSQRSGQMPRKPFTQVSNAFDEVSLWEEILRSGFVKIS